MNLQDAYLNQLRVTKTSVTIYLTGGHQIKGFVKGFDNFIVLIESAGKDNLVYKHAVSTITPQTPLSFFKEKERQPDSTEANNEPTAD